MLGEVYPEVANRFERRIRAGPLATKGVEVAVLEGEEARARVSLLTREAPLVDEAFLGPHLTEGVVA